MMQPQRHIQSYNSKHRDNFFTYDVKRDVYNEETFQREHRRRTTSSGNMDIGITTVSHDIQCRCSWHKFLRCMLMLFPFLEWMCLYRFKDWLLGDLLAGINVGLVQVPQVLTLSLLARQLIPPFNVSYAAFCSSVIYVIFGSCHQMSIGPFFCLSALMINVLRLYPFNSGHLLLGTFIRDDFSNPLFYVAYNRSLSVVASTAFLTGIIQLSMGMLGFGFIATYLPEAVISAYLTATALHIVVSQLTCIFGTMVRFHAGPIAFFYNIVNYCISLPKANSTSILLFLTTVVALRINKCIRISFNQYPIEFPMEVFLILGFAAFANKISMATESSRALIDMIPYSLVVEDVASLALAGIITVLFRFLFPVTPDLNILPEIILQALSLAFVSSSLLVFLGKKIASFHNYNVNSNQDLIAIGLCNVVGSFFRCCVFTGAVARTIIQNKSGGRQQKVLVTGIDPFLTGSLHLALSPQFASLVGAGVMLLLMVKVGHFFLELPNAVLAGIILSNIMPYLETIYHLPNLWRQSQHDCIIWIVTFMSAVTLGLDIGLLVSIAFSFFMITVQSHRTKILLLGQIPNTNIYRSVNDYREIITIPGVKIFQCCNSITFVNVHHLKAKLLREVEMVRVPLKEEDIFYLFNRSSDGSQERKICRCFCNCDELESPPRVTYRERFESKLDYDTSSINLIRCSRLESGNTSYTSSDEQIPYRAASAFQRNQGQYHEDMEKVWLSYNPSRRNNLMAPHGTSENQVRSRSFIPHSETSLLPSIHTIILDFSMVHFVDSQASVILRQMCNAFQNANILVLIAGSHSSVVRAFERDNFFDAGITKAQLFLTLHDAVLFALSRKFPEPSELSVDESEAVIQETYSETDKEEESRHKMSSGTLEVPQNVSSGFTTIQEAITEEESELDVQTEALLESEQETACELEPESELEPETEPEPEPEPESEPEPEPEPEPKSRPRAQTYPQQQYWPLYQPKPPSSPSQTQPRTQSWR